MSKYSIDLKLEIVNKIKNDNYSFSELEREYNIDHSVIIDWYKKYEKNGKEGFLLKNKKYTGSFKQKVVEYKKNNNLSFRDTMILFDMPSKAQIVNWEKIYDKEGPQVLYKERCGKNRK